MVGAEDDDGNSASASTQQKPSPIFDTPNESVQELKKAGASAGAGQYFEAKRKVAGNKCFDCPDGTYVNNPKTGKTFVTIAVGQNSKAYSRTLTNILSNNICLSRIESCATFNYIMIVM